ncbi:DUF2971 domain-containing protein [Vibrio parahaemolyticus]|uniref:DUF2971 domain-containing protein n=1 Tax=Vibrio parahaemolyticus TaxID=670 RepID=UPI00111D510E|nr:DUF2971 domain-containing protein [Vibrio parahaemolyticus]TNY79157.1 hypothetical protein CGK62_05245 [Vibrio parahaemolyticus]
MHNSLFKYTTFRKEFFEDFLIRVTQKYALNDPFELTPGGEGKVDNSIIKDAYFDHAVFSLSETKNNLLMWSHYAQDHKGIVIEFDANEKIFSQDIDNNKRVLSFIDDMKDKKYEHFNEPFYIQDFYEEVVIDIYSTKNYRLLSPGSTHRVLYNPERPDFNKCNSILEHFLVKSDAWIYEKEHRVILPLLDVEKLVIDLEYEKLVTESFWLQTDLNKSVKKGRLHITNPQDVIIEEIMESTRGAYTYMERTQPQLFDEICTLLRKVSYSNFLLKLSEDPSSVFLYKVNPKAIKAVYMGCRMDKTKKTELNRLLIDTPSLRHVELYDSEVSKSRFELQFKRVVENRYSTSGKQGSLF